MIAVAFLKSVAEAFVEHGIGGIAKMVPGGEYLKQVAESAYRRYQERRNEQAVREAVRDEFQQLADQNFEAAKRMA